VSFVQRDLESWADLAWFAFNTAMFLITLAVILFFVLMIAHDAIKNRQTKKRNTKMRINS
jgi:hypothetical protein